MFLFFIWTVREYPSPERDAMKAPLAAAREIITAFARESKKREVVP
jgi:hypothetical protein